jgi:hypothetical protein
MILKFSNHLKKVKAESERTLKKYKSFENKIIFTNGFNASGKTMLGPIISSIEKVESMLFPYEIEWVSSFLYNESISQESYREFVRQYIDHSIYNQMMGRNSNFRVSDISSVLKSKHKFQYIKRLFKKGDNHIVEKIKSENHTLSFVTCNLIFFIQNLADTLGSRMLFIETVRDPIYMFKQLKILFKQVIIDNPEKDFTIRVRQDNFSSFYFDYFTDSKFFFKDSNNIDELVVMYLERIIQFYSSVDFKNLNLNGSTLLILPFENFVTSPDPWINNILNITDSKKDFNLKQEMKKQKVPRKILTEGLKRDVYERYGNKPDNFSKDDYVTNDQKYRQNLSLEFDGGDNNHHYKKLIEISNNYYNWIENFNNNFLFK